MYIFIDEIGIYIYAHSALHFNGTDRLFYNVDQNTVK